MQNISAKIQLWIVSHLESLLLMIQLLAEITQNVGWFVCLFVWSTGILCKSIFTWLFFQALLICGKEYFPL